MRPGGGGAGGAGAGAGAGAVAFQDVVGVGLFRVGRVVRVAAGLPEGAGGGCWERPGGGAGGPPISGGRVPWGVVVGGPGVPGGLRGSGVMPGRFCC
jgi:hypothetical protein